MSLQRTEMVKVCIGYNCFLDETILHEVLRCVQQISLVNIFWGVKFYEVVMRFV